jgi:hypothetical protein
MNRKKVLAICMIATVAGAILFGVNYARDMMWTQAFNDYLKGNNAIQDTNKFSVVSSSKLKDGVIVIFADKLNSPPHFVYAAYVSPGGSINHAMGARGIDGKMTMSKGSFNIDLSSPGPEISMPRILPNELKKYLTENGMTL